MTCKSAGRSRILSVMLNMFRTLLTSLPLAMLPAVAALATSAGTDPVPTGITAVGPSVFIFTIAAAVLLTLLIRASAHRVTRQVGERAGNRRLRRQLQALGRDVKSDCLLPGAYGGIARIDHVLLTAGGLVCIRAIHASGTVSGGENEPQWVIAEGSRRRRFLNPIIQNEGRSRALRKALPEVPVTNLVVFTGNVTFAAQPPANVVRGDALESFATKHGSGPGHISDRDAVWRCLNAAVLDDAASQKDFAAQISFG